MSKYGEDNLAVKMAFAETTIVQQTKEWLKDNGVDLDKLEGVPRKQIKRSKTTLLVKNIPYTTKEKDIREIFSRYGELSNIMLSPMNTIGIVQYANESQA